MKKAKGSMDGKQRKIAVSFDPVLFKRISVIAEKNARSFRAQVNELCKLGLLFGKFE